MENTITQDMPEIVYLSEVSSKDSLWDSKKLLGRQTSRLYDIGGYESYSKRIFDCGQTLGFKLLTGCDGSIHLRLSTARFCRVRLCPVCLWRRSIMWRGRFLRALPRLMADHPTARFIFLTLTVRNCDLKDLKNTLAMMNKAWDKLQRRKSFPAIGWVKSVEVTRGKDGSAHPHFHCLLMVKGSYFKRGYVSQQTWTDWWQDVLGVDYSPVVNVKRVKNRKKSKVNNTVNSKLTGDISQLESAVRSDQVSKPVLDEDLLAAVLETVKYSVKAEDYVKDSDWLIELTKQLHKTRAIALGGLIKQYVKEDEPEDLITEEPTEDIDLEDQDLLLIFDWAEILRRYAKRS